MGVRQHDLLLLAIAQKVLTKLLCRLPPKTKLDQAQEHSYPCCCRVSRSKRKVWESASLPKNTRWKERFECDRPPCSSRGFVQISQNPFARCSKTPCSSRGFGGPCSSRRFGGDFWKVLQHFSGTVKRSQLRFLPRRQKAPRPRNSYQQSTGLPPPSRRTGNSALIRRNALALLGVASSGGKYCCSLQQKDQISSAENTSARQRGRLGHCSTVSRCRTELYSTEARAWPYQWPRNPE